MTIVDLVFKGFDSVSAAIADGSKELKKLNKKHKITKKITDASEASLDTVVRFALNPRELSQFAEEFYGKTRTYIKSNSDSETPLELLTQSRNELINISSCILQISKSDSENIASEFGNAVLGKVAGIATTGTLLALVGAFGTAGTGAAISGLSGAAATSATLAWVGGLLGGGMATGAVLTGGIGIVAGLAAYKALKSKPRSFDDLSINEQLIVQSCWMLIALIDDELSKKTVRFNSVSAKLLLKNTLVPLGSMLKKSKNTILKNLDQKHAFLFKNHILIDYDRYVIAGFKSYIKRHMHPDLNDIEKAISSEIYNLLTDKKKNNSTAFENVALALRLSNKKHYNASDDELSSYIKNCSKSRLIQVAANVKMIYTELLWIDEYNSCHEDTFAEVSIKTKENRPMILIKNIVSNKIRDRWPLISSVPKEIVDLTLNAKPSEVSNLQPYWNNADSPRSAVEVLARKAGLSVAATAFTSLLFS